MPATAVPDRRRVREKILKSNFLNGDILFLYKENIFFLQKVGFF